MKIDIMSRWLGRNIAEIFHIFVFNIFTYINRYSQILTCILTHIHRYSQHARRTWYHSQRGLRSPVVSLEKRLGQSNHWLPCVNMCQLLAICQLQSNHVWISVICEYLSCVNVFQWQMDFIQIYLLVVLQENIMRWREDIALLQPRERVVVNWENCLWHLGAIIGSSVWISVKGMTVWRCPRVIWSTQELESIWVTDFQCSLNDSFFLYGKLALFFLYIH